MTAYPKKTKYYQPETYTHFHTYSILHVDTGNYNVQVVVQVGKFHLEN